MGGFQRCRERTQQVAEEGGKDNSEQLQSSNSKHETEGKQGGNQCKDQAVDSQRIDSVLNKEREDFSGNNLHNNSSCGEEYMGSEFGAVNFVKGLQFPYLVDK